MLVDLEDRTGYATIRKDRAAERPAGGVAILYRKAAVQMSKIKLPASDFEVVAAIGLRTGQRRKVVAMSIYIPPSYNAE